ANKIEGAGTDYVNTMGWFLKATEQDYVLMGHGVAKDAAQASEWFLKAAEQKHAEAQYHIEHLYNVDKGVTRDDEKGVYWLRKTAEQGQAAAQCNLGSCYFLVWTAFLRRIMPNS
ncbi:hypothetical protein BG015_004225, partial [Linnemannia schmuckeri]